MSFTSILNKIIGVAYPVEHLLAPIAATFAGPAVGNLIMKVDSLFGTVQQSIMTAEANSPVGGGQLKSDAVVADFQSGLAVTQQILALEGKQLTYDDAALQAAITAQVAAYNAFAQVKASFKIVPIPAAPTK